MNINKEIHKGVLIRKGEKTECEIFAHYVCVKHRFKISKKEFLIKRKRITILRDTECVDAILLGDHFHMATQTMY